MNYIDLIIIFALVVFVLFGYLRGFIKDMLDLLVLILAIFLSSVFYLNVGSVLQSAFSLPQSFANATAFFFIWFSVEFIYYIFYIFWFPYIPEHINESDWNHWLGVVPGFLRGAFVIWLIANIAFILPLSSKLHQDLKNSLLASPALTYNTEVSNYIDKTFGNVIEDTVKFVTVKPESAETIQLGFTVANPTAEPQTAKDMLTLVNQERSKDGKKPLVFDDKLASVAEAHGRDMFARGYFSHNTPEGLTPFDRMTKAGIQYFTAGENLALAPTLSAAHTGLMNSPGHRANILNVDFGRVGISVLDGGKYGKIFVQEFTN